MWNDQDLKQMEAKGITTAQIDRQLERFAQGFPWLHIETAATVENGIVSLTPKQESSCIQSWKQFDGTIEKFVPASGAASRMFKDLYAFVNSGRTEPETQFERAFFEHIQQFAFYSSLNKTCVRLHEMSVSKLIEAGRHVDVVRALLDADGMNYGGLPKGLLQFHKAAGGTVHTPVEEHLEEGAQYAADHQRLVNLHFTVSPEHRKHFERLLAQRVPLMEKVWGVTYHVSMSEQKPSTDTIAVMADNTPYRDENGSLLFRPAGHGALIENLNERDADVIFVKNIDNVVPLTLRHTTTRYKKVIAGYLVQIQAHVAHFLEQLEQDCSHDQLQKILEFVEKFLFTTSDQTAHMTDEQLANYLRSKLNRPIRVCGMVKNEGEPGGGPYLAYNSDGSCSLQILEAAQINPDDSAAIQMMKSGTHFNPVDLVCYIKDYKGQKFDLRNFVDPNTGLISEKSKNGVAIKALELPGLWNGSMSDWITIFVEVPIDTFNPVKTVNDLLRPQHQS